MRPPQVDPSAGRCTVAHCPKHYRVPARWECRLYWAGHVAPEQPGFKSGGLRHLGGPAGASLQGQEVRHCWSVEAGDRAGMACTTTALHWSQHQRMETSSSVRRGSEWRTHWTPVSLTICTIQAQTLCCEIVVTDILLKTRFLMYVYDFLWN